MDELESWETSNALELAASYKKDRDMLNTQYVKLETENERLKSETGWKSERIKFLEAELDRARELLKRVTKDDDALFGEITAFLSPKPSSEGV